MIHQHNVITLEFWNYNPVHAWTNKPPTCLYNSKPVHFHPEWQHQQSMISHFNKTYCVPFQNPDRSMFHELKWIFPILWSSMDADTPEHMAGSHHNRQWSCARWNIRFCRSVSRKRTCLAYTLLSGTKRPGVHRAMVHQERPERGRRSVHVCKDVGMAPTYWSCTYFGDIW